jgi:hypothetical protein
MHRAEMKGAYVTKLDELLNEVREIKNKLFIESDSFQNRLTRLEESVMNCQRRSQDRIDGNAKLKASVFVAFMASMFSLIVSWFKTRN